MTDLIARIESADGPDRELFQEIRRAIGTHQYDAYSWRLFLRDTQWSAFLDVGAWTCAAEMLVPEGWHMSVNTTVGALLQGSAAVRDRDGGPSFASAASTPALALAAAALKARGV